MVVGSTHHGVLGTVSPGPGTPVYIKHAMQLGDVGIVISRTDGEVFMLAGGKASWALISDGTQAQE